MRALLLLALTALLLAGCSHSLTEPAPTAAVIPTPSPVPSSASSIWSANSTVLDVSATRNSCLTDNSVGQTRTEVGWTIKEDATSITLIEAAGAIDLRTPYYTGSLTGSQFTASTWQDGGFDCFVWGGDLSGSFSADRLTFDAIETIEYRHLGESPMQVRRHWIGRRR